MLDWDSPSWRSSLAGFAVILAILFGGMWVNHDFASAATKPKPEPLVIKAGVVHGDPVRVIRAVLGNKLYVFYFVHAKGVWWLLAAKPAVQLPGA